MFAGALPASVGVMYLSCTCPVLILQSSLPGVPPPLAIAKRLRVYVTFLVTDQHTKFQRLATNGAQGGHPGIRTQFDLNIQKASIWPNSLELDRHPFRPVA